ncbi:MAG: hypothetical protein PHT78_11455 [Desulfitobacteriaceae bacterium]|nr:hypothetical protein [Desulfitobacteriaceae bacterium]
MNRKLLIDCLPCLYSVIFAYSKCLDGLEDDNLRETILDLLQETSQQAKKIRLLYKNLFGTDL